MQFNLMAYMYYSYAALWIYYSTSFFPPEMKQVPDFLIQLDKINSAILHKNKSHWTSLP